MSNKGAISSVSYQRRAGILLHPTSLPGPYNNGDIGHQAYRFIEFLAANGFKVWQVLPLGTTHEDKSPYQCLSSHAGNPLLISLDWLIDRGWLKASDINKTDTGDSLRLNSLKKASNNFYTSKVTKWIDILSEFKTKHEFWLDDYALFVACKEHFDNKPWYEWPEEVRHREEDELNDLKSELKLRINEVVFEQFVFFTQWHEIREYAKQHNVEIFGDMPIFVARDSADVWSKRDNFLMNSDGVMEFVSGVPPDAFSTTGQRWGNPLYNWTYMSENSFHWWKERFHSQLELFDLLRIDHFRGLQACWQIPGNDETAVNGKWVEVPGKELLQTLFHEFKDLPLIAEDLGVITDEVTDLKNHFKLPGMKVLQFAFDGNVDNPHLPHHQHPDDVVYSGTHDNDTTLGWASNKNNFNKNFLESYLGTTPNTEEDIAISIIRAVFSSVSFLCVIPMQDLLMLNAEARMNIPGTIEGNWKWRFEWDQVKPEVTQQITEFISLYQR